MRNKFKEKFSVMSGNVRRPFDITAFVQDERGTMTTLSLFLLLGMIALGGMTVDLMRHEAIRTQLQSTSDRAVLAAADLDQTSDAEAVVRDYIAKAGFEDYIQDIIVAPGVNYMSVEANLSVDMPTWFMNMSGIDSIPAKSSSKAEEKVPNIEVSLVLDISGSMGWASAEPGKTKIEVLRSAANTFSDTMMSANTTFGNGLTSVSIIPYHAVVNVGQPLISKFNVETHHTYSDCVRFTPSQFDSIAIYGGSGGTSLDRLSNFDRNNKDYHEVGGTSQLERPWCQKGSYGAILPHSVSLTDLQGKINSLNAQGNTAIDLGVKWAAALLDPSTTAITNDLIADSVLDSQVEDRPVPYSDVETIKVMVVMTDGENTTQYDLKPEFKNTMAPVWYSEDEKEYSSFFQSRADAGEAPYWIPATYSDGSPRTYWSSGNEYGSRTYGRWEWNVSGSDAMQMAHSEVFDTFSVRFISNYLFWTDDNYGGVRTQRDSYKYAVESYTTANPADTYTEKVCDQLIANNVVIFSIAFEAPSRGRDLMQYCASQPGNYFDVAGADIEQAFSSIADKIQQLRLTY